MNAGISVSRVGGAAQIAAMKKVAGKLRLDLAQYRELAAFSQFGSDLDKATQQQLARGARMTEVLKQGQYQPLPVEKQVLILFSVTNGYTDPLPLEAIGRYEHELYAFVDARHPDLWNELRTKGGDSKAWDSLVTRMRAAIGEFGKEFAVETKAA